MRDDYSALSTVLFWVFIVCGLLSLWIFHGKLSDGTDASNAWGWILGGVAVVSIIVSRFLAVAAIVDDEDSKK